jgi:hypothetical protein
MKRNLKSYTVFVKRILKIVCHYKYSAFGKSLSIERTIVSRNSNNYTLYQYCTSTEYSETTAHFSGNFNTDDQIYVL